MTNKIFQEEHMKKPRDRHSVGDWWGQQLMKVRREGQRQRRTRGGSHGGQERGEHRGGGDAAPHPSLHLFSSAWLVC